MLPLIGWAHTQNDPCTTYYHASVNMIFVIAADDLIPN